jgi:hypothetical protein
MDRKYFHAQTIPLRCSHRWELIWFVMEDCSMLEVIRQSARDGDLWLDSVLVTPKLSSLPWLVHSLIPLKLLKL